MIFVIIAIIFPKPWSWADLAVIPALGLIVLNCVWVSLFRHPGHPVPRYQPAALQPRPAAVLHDTDHLERGDAGAQGAGRWAKIVELNPLLHYLDIVRAPLLGAEQEVRHWVVVLVLTIIGWIFAAIAMRQYRARVPYWV